MKERPRLRWLLSEKEKSEIVLLILIDRCVASLFRENIFTLRVKLGTWLWEIGITHCILLSVIKLIISTYLTKHLFRIAITLNKLPLFEFLHRLTWFSNKWLCYLYFEVFKIVINCYIWLIIFVFLTENHPWNLQWRMKNRAEPLH